MTYLGIDIGSSFIKAAAFDLETCRAVLHTTFPTGGRLKNPDPKIFELDAGALAGTVRRTIEKIRSAAGRIDGIVLSTQMHGFVFHREGVPDRYVSWQDSRCTRSVPGGEESWLDLLKRRIPPERMRSCGVYLKPSLGLCNLYALVHAEGAGDPSGELFTLGSYVIWKLTGNNICHMTNAAPLGLADVTAGTWDAGLISLLRFDGIRMPRIAPADFQPCGTCRCGGEEIPVFPDYGDQQTAILGSSAGPGDIVVNIATASQISAFSDRFVPGGYEVRPYFEGRYINTISNMPGGRNLDVLISFLRECMEKACGGRPTPKQAWDAVLKDFRQDSRGLRTNLDFYDTPENLRGGAISSIRPENFGIQPLFSAAFEYMARRYCESIRTLTGGKKPRGGLVFSGGISWKTPPLLKVASDAAGLPYRLSSIPNEAFSGLFRIALVCSGVCRSLDENPGMVLKIDEGDASLEFPKNEN